jgi:hypothetical protein
LSSWAVISATEQAVIIAKDLTTNLAVDVLTAIVPDTLVAQDIANVAKEDRRNGSQ